MKKLIAAVALLTLSTSVFANYANCKSKAMTKYMSKGYMWDVAATKAHADCHTPKAASSFTGVMIELMNQGLAYDVAASEASKITGELIETNPEFLEVMISYMNKGYRYDVAAEKAYQELR